MRNNDKIYDENPAEEIPFFFKEKIVSREQAREVINSNPEKRFVTTNGCFDLLHKGHLFLLYQARQMGDALIVGVNSDASVQARKGKHRPILPEMDRAIMLAALSFVDYVIIFQEVHVNELLEFLKPSLHVKGGDYKSLQELDEYQTVTNYGGEIRLVPEMKGYSTSNIVKKILQ